MDIVPVSEGAESRDAVFVRLAREFALFQFTAGDDFHIFAEKDFFPHVSDGFVSH